MVGLRSSYTVDHKKPHSGLRGSVAGTLQMEPNSAACRNIARSWHGGGWKPDKMAHKKDALCGPIEGAHGSLLTQIRTGNITLAASFHKRWLRISYPVSAHGNGVVLHLSFCCSPLFILWLGKCNLEDAMRR